MSDLSIGPFRLGYGDAGLRAADAPVVVALHSGGMSSRQWKRLAELLAPDFRVITPDFLGYGASGAWPAGARFHFALDVLAVEALLRTLDRPVHLVAHSYGGLVALLVALHQPDRVRSLALFEPVAFGVLYSAPGEAAAIANLAQLDDAPGTRAAGSGDVLDTAPGAGEAFLRGFVEWWNGAGAWDAMPEPARAGFRAVVAKLYGEVRTLSADRTPHDAYAAALGERPALLLTGEHSPLAARRVVHVLHGALPASTMHVVHGAGHMAPLTRADEVNALIAAHLRARPPAGP